MTRKNEILISIIIILITFSLYREFENKNKIEELNFLMMNIKSKENQNNTTKEEKIKYLNEETTTNKYTKPFIKIEKKNNDNMIYINNLFIKISGEIENQEIEESDKFFLKVNCYFSESGKFYFNIAQETKEKSEGKEKIINKLIELKKISFEDEMKIFSNRNNNSSSKQINFNILIFNE